MNKLPFFKGFLYLLLPGFLFGSCFQSDVFEKNIQIPKHQWSYDQQPEIQFNITDTLAAYHVFVTLRHTDAYAYKNIWLTIATRQPNDSSFRKERFELTLQQPDGHWIGSGFNDIWEVRYPLFSNIRFLKTGIYTIRLQQIMRDDPLLHIMDAGIRIEKVKE